MSFKNEKLGIFLRRYGGYIAGGLLACGLVALGVIGYKGGNSVAERYYRDYHEKNNSEYASRMENDSSFREQTKQEIYDKVFGIDKLTLKYPAHMKDLDGENFVYWVRFSKDVPKDIDRILFAEIEKKCGKSAEDNYYGYIGISPRPENRTVYIYLDLGNSTDDKAILGILKALNEIDGVESVDINDPDCYAEMTDDSGLNSLAENVTDSRQKHFDDLELYFPVECKGLAEQFTITLTYSSKPGDDVFEQLKKDLDDLLKDSKCPWSAERSGTDGKEITITCDSTAVSQIIQSLYFIPDQIFNLLGEKTSGIEKAVIA